MRLMENLRVACLVTMVTTVLLGVIYPLLVTGAAQVLFPERANGQLVERDGAVVGSRLIGQAFSSPGYFRGRPSATSVPYDAANSGGSQLGPTNRHLVETVRARVEEARRENPSGPVPVDLVTASASGLDPHLSPAAAEFQVPRVARERGLRDAEVRGIVRAHTEGRQWGLFGEARVNVLELNLELDRVAPRTR